MNQKLEYLQELIEVARDLSRKNYILEQALVDALENDALHNLEFSDPTNLSVLDLEVLESTKNIDSHTISATYQELVKNREIFEQVCEMIENLR